MYLMVKINRIFTYKLLLLVLFTSSINTSCKHKPPASSEVKEIIEPNHSIETPKVKHLFDGETLANWEITNFGTQGEVHVSDGEIVLGMGDGCTGITWKDSFPKVNYEVSLEAKRKLGIDFFCGLTFPVKDDFCSFIVGGWAGAVVGLSTIDGFDASENETTSMMRFTKDEWYKIKLRVTSEKIETWINEEKIVDIPYNGRQIGIRPEVELSCPFGIATWKTTGAVRNFYLRML
jgi:hypothetical protein